MKEQGFWSCAYLDDAVCIEMPDKATSAFLTLKNLILKLGLPINESKIIEPTSCMNCLGIMVNARTGELTIPEDKLQEVVELCNIWRTRRFATRKALQKLLGKLIYVHRCVKPARLFVNRILAALRTAPVKGSIMLSDEFYRDIEWFCQFLKDFNGVVEIHRKPVLPIAVYVDACLQGFGGYCQGEVYFKEVPFRFRLNLSIVHLEMLNVLLAIQG